jgi:hypothetical protein
MTKLIRAALIAACFVALFDLDETRAAGGALGCAMATAIYNDCMAGCGDMWEYVWDGTQLVQVYDEGWQQCGNDCRSNYNRSACAN